MKNFTLTMITSVGFMTASALAVLADTKPALAPTHSSGNQLMQNQTHWYEKAAGTVGGASDVSAKGGTLLTLQAGSVLYLEGDSTLHKYQMNANALKGSAVVKGSAGDLLKALKAGSVESMTLVVPVKDLKSRESGLDNNAYKALKLSDNPDIMFALKKESLKTDESGDAVMTAVGNLTIAGNTAPVTLKATAAVKDGKVEIKGVQKLKMSDFKVAPPSISLLVTSINCTDAIEIHYDVIFEAKK